MHNECGNRIWRRAAIAVLIAMPMLVFDRAFCDPPREEVQVTAVINRGISWISLPESSASWSGFVVPDVFYRFNSNILTCRFFAANGPWDIRIYHTNGITRDALRGVAFVGGTWRTNWLQVKVWHPSLGPTNFYAEGILPNPMDNNVWNHALGIRDWQNSPSYFARQAWDMGSPVPFHLIVNGYDAYPATYQGNVFFELSIP